MRHEDAAQHCSEGFEKVFGNVPTRVERQALQGVAWLETRYGGGWGIKTFNMGAIQKGKPPCDPADSFEYTDTTPTSSGASIPYRICFKKYATAADGFMDLARVVYKRRPSVLMAAQSGDLYEVSTALRKTYYYEGFGKTQAERIANHHRALRAAVVRIARALGERMPDGSLPPPLTLRFTSPKTMGQDVVRLQRILVLPETGIYDEFTRDTVKMFQSSRPGLDVDGVVGEHTWEALLEIEKAVGLGQDERETLPGGQ